jgi:hypothetical protein
MPPVTLWICFASLYEAAALLGTEELVTTSSQVSFLREAVDCEEAARAYRALQKFPAVDLDRVILEETALASSSSSS